MIIIVFGMLIVFGIIQLWLWFRIQKLFCRLNSAKAQPTPIPLRIQRQSIFQNYIVILLQDIYLHLVGTNHSLFIRNVSIVILIQCVGIYVNQEYLQFRLYIMLPLVFFLTIYILYQHKKKKMRREFEISFSEALNIINSSLRAGNSVIQGIAQCGQKMDGLLGGEFRHIMLRLEIGEEIESVLRDSWIRQPYREYYFFITAVLINMKGGGQVREVMSRLSAIISNARIIERKKYSMTAEARMSVKILALIPVGFLFFMKYQSPANFSILLNHPIGQMMLGYSVGSIMLGLFIVWMMMNKI